MKRIRSSSCCSCFSATRVQVFGIVNRYSWFWKSYNLTDPADAFSFFQGTHVLITTMNTRFGKWVHLKDLTQFRLINQVLRRQHVKITWQTKTIIFQLPESPWPQSLAVWWLTLRGSYPCSSTLWSPGFARSREKLKQLHLHERDVYVHHIWQGCDLPWGVSPMKSHVPFITWSCKIT